MINKKKFSIFVLIVIALAIVVILIGIFAAGKVNKQVAINKASRSQSISLSQNQTDQNSSSSKKGNSASRSSSQKSNEQVSEKKVLTQFLKNYSTVKLNNDYIDSRANTLKESMTDIAYEANYIEQDSNSLKSLLSKYEKTKQIDTSNSTQLVSRQYLKCNLYLNANIPGQYYVELFFTETPVYQTKGYSMEAKYNITMADAKVSSLDLISQKQS